MTSTYVGGMILGIFMALCLGFLLWKELFEFSPTSPPKGKVALLLFGIIVGAIEFGISGGLLIAHELAK